MTTATTYAERVKVRDLEPGDHYATRPLGEVRTLILECARCWKPVDQGAGGWYHLEEPGDYHGPHEIEPRTSLRRADDADDVLRFPRYPLGRRSLHAEFDAWAHHAGTGRPMDSKRYSSVSEIIRHGDGSISLRLHSTDVVTASPEDVLTLRTGGWPTMTTSDYIEGVLPESWWILKRGSEVLWALYTDAEVECSGCGSTDPDSGEPCPKYGEHYYRASHEIAFREGMTVDLHTGRLTEGGDRDASGEFLEGVKSWPKGYHRHPGYGPWGRSF